MSGTRFDYEQAFAANLGLLNPEEQATLRRSTVAIAGMGGVGGAYLLAFTRLGIGRFSIADADVFELRNFNRQFGATTETLGKPKTAAMVEAARAINPELAIRAFPDGVNQGNIDDFLAGCDVAIDGVDFFAIATRRLLFARARQFGIPVITCGPLGFGAALLVFTPQSPSFDDFFAIDDRMDETEQIARFAVGLSPAALHLSYLDPRHVSLRERRGPSSVIAIHLCAGVAAAEAMSVLLKRRAPWSVPRYAHFDPYRLRYRKGVLWGGNRHPWQRVKLWYIRRLLARHARES